ncbi:undecaprenyl diphosphate synthase family protein [Kocuria rhizophila]|nr:undecaprenyl diphosphate synthase family protein [Kocuria rhizophila]
MASDAREGLLKPGCRRGDTVQRYLDEPRLPDVDMFLPVLREQRLSNFMLWQSAYAELVFLTCSRRTWTGGCCGEPRCRTTWSRTGGTGER